MKDLCVPIPNFGEDEIADIELRVGDKKMSYSFRVESFPWQVDDELSVRDSLSNWFIEDGYAVDTAEDAKIALKKIEARNFPIVLVDIKLPGMDGLELNRRIKAINEDTIVIIMTAFASVTIPIDSMRVSRVTSL